MDELKHRAGEKLGALHEAAKTAADSGKSRVQDVVNQTVEAIKKVREAFQDLWNNELIAEGRGRVVDWSREAVKRIKEGAPPLSPVVLYEELLALLHDRVWRRSLVIFACGLAAGGAAGLALGLRAGAAPPAGPHARALHTHSDHTVILVEDAVAPGAGAGEVLVRVQAFSICSVDRAALRGRGRGLRALLAPGPVTVGRGFAGVILDVGHGVQDLEMGDEVWGCVSEWSGGAATELLTIRSTRVGKRPRGVTADSAASLPWAGSTALAALRRLAITRDNAKGKRVAVCGAASGEGCVLVQLLACWGAHVTALAPHHAALTLRDLGAQEYVDAEEGSAEHCPSCWLALERRALRAGPWDAALACRGARGGEVPPHSSLLKYGGYGHSAPQRHTGHPAAALYVRPPADAHLGGLRRHLLHVQGAQVAGGLRLAHGLAGGAAAHARRARRTRAHGAGRRDRAHAGQGVPPAGVRERSRARVQRARARHHSAEVPVTIHYAQHITNHKLYADIRSR